MSGVVSESPDPVELKQNVVESEQFAVRPFNAFVNIRFFARTTYHRFLTCRKFESDKRACITEAWNTVVTERHQSVLLHTNVLVRGNSVSRTVNRAARIAVLVDSVRHCLNKEIGFQSFIRIRDFFQRLHVEKPVIVKTFFAVFVVCKRVSVGGKPFFAGSKFWKHVIAIEFEIIGINAVEFFLNDLRERREQIRVKVSAVGILIPPIDLRRHRRHLRFIRFVHAYSEDCVAFFEFWNLTVRRAVGNAGIDVNFNAVISEKI